MALIAPVEVVTASNLLSDCNGGASVRKAGLELMGDAPVVAMFADCPSSAFYCSCAKFCNIVYAVYAKLAVNE